MKEKGFTIVELLVTIGIVVIVSALAIPLYGRWQIDNQAEFARNNIFQFLHLARSRAQAGHHDVRHGVYINGSAKQAVYYEGAEYANRASQYDRVFSYADTIDISTTMAGDEISFRQGSGRPIATGTISIVDLNSPNSYTIFINATGVIE